MMNHLLLFESYVSSMYEMDLKSAVHYSQRTSLDHIISRVVPNTPNYTSGFVVDVFVNDKNSVFSSSEIQDILGIDKETMDRYISKTLNILTNNESLANWKPNNKKPEQIIDLGRICFSLYSNRYYPIIQAGDDKGGFYKGGDSIWLIAKENDKAITFKYYESSPSGKKKAYIDSRNNAVRDYGQSAEDFNKNYAFGYPYGMNFVTVIDLTNDPEDEDSIMLNVKNQIERKRI